MRMKSHGVSLIIGAHECNYEQQCPAAGRISEMGHFFCLSILLILTTISSVQAQVLRLSDGNIVPFEQMIEDVKNVDVVFVGEYHIDPKGHAAQLHLIKALAQNGVPLVIGLEMFRANAQGDLDAWIRGELTVERFQQVYRDNWNYPWSQYQDILLYARERNIPLIGLNVPGEITRKIAREGFTSLMPEELKQLPPGIECNVDDTYRDFIQKAYRAHGSGSEHSFTNFCEAQMIWDNAMAWHLVEYLRKNPGRVAVVLAGGGHAWKHGTPAQTKKYSAISFRVVLPVSGSDRDVSILTARDADYILID